MDDKKGPIAYDEKGLPWAMRPEGPNGEAGDLIPGPPKP